MTENSNRQVVINVVSSLEQTRQNDFEELQTEFENSTRLINGLFENWKRKFIESGAVPEYKKARTSSSNTSASTHTHHDKENANPNVNVNIVQEGYKKPPKPSSSSSSSSSSLLTSASASSKSTRKHQTNDENNDGGEQNMSVVVEEEQQQHQLNIIDLDVNSMKVAELRKHLRSFGLDQQGLKRTLQLRLQCAIDEHNAREREEFEMKKRLMEDQKQRDRDREMTREQQQQQQQERKEDTDADADAKFAPVSISEDALADAPMDIVEEKKASIGSSGMEAENVGAEDAAENEANVQKSDVVDVEVDDASMESVSVVGESAPVPNTVEDNVQTQTQPQSQSQSQSEQPSKSPKKKAFGSKFIKATTKLFSPNKNKKKSPNDESMDVQMQDATAPSASASGNATSKVQQNSASNTNMKPSSADSTLSPSKRASMVCEMRLSEINEEREKEVVSNVQLMSTTKNIPTTASKLQKSKSKLAGTTTPTVKMAGAPLSSSKAQAKMRELEEARKARLDKIRNKVAQTQASVAVPYSSSKLKSAQKTSSKDSAEERKKAIAAKMRSKVMAGTGTSNASSATASTVSMTSGSVRANDGGSASVNASVSTGTAASASKPYPTASMTSSSGSSHSSSASHQKQTPHQPQQPKKAMSPMETYEMSDREESDSDASEDSEYYSQKPKKKVPRWAQKDRLIPALEKQFMDNEDRLDPDEIFHEVLTCDLEAIFGQRKKRYAKRASTGNWTKDRVTASEKLVYKRKMGYNKKK